MMPPGRCKPGSFKLCNRISHFRALHFEHNLLTCPTASSLPSIPRPVLKPLPSSPRGLSRRSPSGFACLLSHPTLPLNYSFHECFGNTSDSFTHSTSILPILNLTLGNPRSVHFLCSYTPQCCYKSHEITLLELGSHLKVLRFIFQWMPINFLKELSQSLSSWLKNSSSPAAFISFLFSAEDSQHTPHTMVGVGPCLKGWFRSHEPGDASATDHVLSSLKWAPRLFKNNYNTTLRILCPES